MKLSLADSKRVVGSSKKTGRVALEGKAKPIPFNSNKSVEKNTRSKYSYFDISSQNSSNYNSNNQQPPSLEGILKQRSNSSPKKQ